MVAKDKKIQEQGVEIAKLQGLKVLRHAEPENALTPLGAPHSWQANMERMMTTEKKALENQQTGSRQDLMTELKDLKAENKKLRKSLEEAPPATQHSALY